MPEEKNSAGEGSSTSISGTSSASDGAGPSSSSSDDAIRLADNIIYKDAQEILESDLSCAICQDIYINPLILNCSHSFCKFCLIKWLSTRNGCPQCRMTVSFQAENLALRNIVNRIIQKSSPQFQQNRTKNVTQRLKDEQEQENKDESKVFSRGRARRPRPPGAGSSDDVVTAAAYYFAPLEMRSGILFDHFRGSYMSSMFSHPVGIDLTSDNHVSDNGDSSQSSSSSESSSSVGADGDDDEDYHEDEEEDSDDDIAGLTDDSVSSDDSRDQTFDLDSDMSDSSSVSDVDVDDDHAQIDADSESSDAETEPASDAMEAETGSDSDSGRQTGRQTNSPRLRSQLVHYWGELIETESESEETPDEDESDDDDDEGDYDDLDFEENNDGDEESDDEDQTDDSDYVMDEDSDSDTTSSSSSSTHSPEPSGIGSSRSARSRRIDDSDTGDDEINEAAAEADVPPPYSYPEYDSLDEDDALMCGYSNESNIEYGTSSDESSLL